jgi:hypothetical protein
MTSRTTWGKGKKTAIQKEQLQLVRTLKEVNDRLKELLRRKFESDKEVQKELGIYEPSGEPAPQSINVHS